MVMIILSLFLCVCYSLEVEELEVGGNARSKFITGLRPFTDYTVSVLASTAVGEGPANTTEFTTDEAGGFACLCCVLPLSDVCWCVTCMNYDCH